jgi:hypothetical protein
MRMTFLTKELLVIIHRTVMTNIWLSCNVIGEARGYEDGTKHNEYCKFDPHPINNGNVTLMCSHTHASNYNYLKDFEHCTLQIRVPINELGQSIEGMLVNI